MRSHFKFILPIIILLFTCKLIGQNRYSVNQIYVDIITDTIYHKDGMEPLNGVVYCEFGEMGTYVNGEKYDGLYKAWYENGQLMNEGNYKDGDRDCLCKTWYENGQLMSKENWRDGLQDGLFKEWYRNGQLMLEAKWNGGKQQGAQKAWHENGLVAKAESIISEKILF